MENALRPFPKEVQKPGATRAFVEMYKRAFEADPSATFSAGQLDGITIVIAREGWQAECLREFVVNRLGGVIQVTDFGDSPTNPTDA